MYSLDIIEGLCSNSSIPYVLRNGVKYHNLVRRRKKFMKRKNKKKKAPYITNRRARVPEKLPQLPKPGRKLKLMRVSAGGSTHQK
jgi:hypothetical protein